MNDYKDLDESIKDIMISEYRNDVKSGIYKQYEQNIKIISTIFEIAVRYYNEYWFNERIEILEPSIESNNFLSFKRYYYRAICIKCISEGVPVEMYVNDKPHGVILKEDNILKRLRTKSYKLDPKVKLSVSECDI